MLTILGYLIYAALILGAMWGLVAFVVSIIKALVSEITTPVEPIEAQPFGIEGAFVLGIACVTAVIFFLSHAN